MKRSAILVTLFSIVFAVLLPFVGGSGPSLFQSATVARAETARMPIFATDSADSDTATTAPHAPPSSGATADRLEREVEAKAIKRQARIGADAEHLAQAPIPAPLAEDAQQRRADLEASGLSCPSATFGISGNAPARTAGGGLIGGTTTADVAAFARQYNSIRVANCLQPVPAENIRYDSCMEDRLFWMAEDPSDDPLSAWGHTGSVRSDGVASVGCDGNLAGGGGDTGSTVATKWWDSSAHRASLYKPTYGGATSGVCVYLAMTHGGLGATVNEPTGFARAAARWGTC